MEESRKNPFGDMRLKMWVPVIIGILVVIWLFHDDFRPEVWQQLQFTLWTVPCLIGALAMIVGRDFGLTWRFRILTDYKLSWRSALRVCMLVEFSSAVTPTTAGGSALSLFFLHREGIDYGRSTALMMTTLLLDIFFFVVFCPLAVALISASALFGFGSSFPMGIKVAFWLVYALNTAWAALLFAGVIAKPEAVHSIVMWVARIKWLRKRHDKVRTLADDIVATGHDLRHRSASWWSKAIAATVTSWLSRFLLVNMLFLAFVPSASQIVVLGRQIVVWLLLTVSPTPGGSGISEWLFTEYYGDLISDLGLALVIALCWRVLSYYLYLIIGAFIVPSWIREGWQRRNANQPTQNR